MLAELNEIVASAGAKEAKDDDDNNDSSGGVGGKVKRSKKRAPAAEAEQQKMFVEKQAESEAALPARQTASVPEPLEATAPVSQEHPELAANRKPLRCRIKERCWWMPLARRRM